MPVAGFRSVPPSHRALPAHPGFHCGTQGYRERVQQLTCRLDSDDTATKATVTEILASRSAVFSLFAFNFANGKRIRFSFSKVK